MKPLPPQIVNHSVFLNYLKKLQQKKKKIKNDSCPQKKCNTQKPEHDFW